jgi:hypothetical protein
MKRLGRERFCPNCGAGIKVSIERKVAFFSVVVLILFPGFIAPILNIYFDLQMPWDNLVAPYSTIAYLLFCTIGLLILGNLVRWRLTKEN